MHRRGPGHLGHLRGGRLSERTDPRPAAAGTLKVTRFSNVDDFLARAGDFLVAREAEHNLIFGLCTGIRVAPDAFDGTPYLAVVEDDARILGAAVQTPPNNLVLSHFERADALTPLAGDLAALGSALPGVFAERAPASEFAAAWTRRTGRRAALARRERIYQLVRVRAPTAVPGQLRQADADDRALLIEWLGAFWREALGDDDVSDAPEMVDRWLRNGSGPRGYRRMYVWEDGEPVSMAGAGGATPNGIRIGPVYTPPRLRGRGYASACVAAVSQTYLDAGRRVCFLFTDLANPTANHIYREIGYEPVCDVDEYRFGPSR